MQHRLNIYRGKKFVESQFVNARPLPRSADFPYEVDFGGAWVPAIFDKWGILAINIGGPTAIKTQPRKLSVKVPPAAIPAAPAVEAPTVDPLDYSWDTGRRLDVALTPYEAWKAGKLGHGPKVKAPKGAGAEWAARLYCERAIERAKNFRDSDYSRRQLRAGSRASRRRGTVKAAKSAAWDEGLTIAEAIYHAAIPGGGDCWQGKKELIQEAFAYSSHLLYLAGN